MNFSAPDILKTIDRSSLSPTLSPLPSGGKSTAQSFSHLLSNTTSTDPILAAKGKQEKAEKAAGDLVSNALILPMLKQLRRSPWGENTVFSGGIGEKTFGPEFDMQIADRIAHGPRLAVKAALAARLMQRGSPDAIKHTDFKKLDIHG